MSANAFINRIIRPIVFLIILPGGTLNSTWAAEAPQKEPYQELETIHQQVLEYIKQKADQKVYEPQFKIRKLSQRLKLPKCQTELQLEDRNPENSVGRMTIGVQCQTPKWRIYVPAEIKGKLPLVQTTKAILKGESISPDDIEVKLVPHNQIPNGAAIKPESLIGMRSLRSLSANSVIKVRYLQPPYWVFKNQNVNILTRIGNIEVTTVGIALKDAVEGEQVAVKNLKSQKVIKGIVIAPNTVLIP